MTTVFLHLLISFSLFSTIVPLASPPLSPPSPTVPANCSDELVRLSACLPYISSHPNNLTRLPTSDCCHNIASAVTSGTAVCLCYLIRQPLMLGFPLNPIRLLSLAKCCQVKDLGNKRTFSLYSVCSGSPILPPLRSVPGYDGHSEKDSPGGKGSASPSKQNSGPDNLVSPSTCSDSPDNIGAPVPGPMPIPADDYSNFEPQDGSAANMGTQPSISASFARYSSRWRWFIPKMMILAPLLST